MTAQSALDIGRRILTALKLTGVSLADVVEPGEYEDFIAAACDALENADKYRWHSKDDVPERPEKYLIVFTLYDNNITHYGTELYNDGWNVPDYVKVVAWKCIEPFREAEG